jgi:hypothetical protein
MAGCASLSRYALIGRPVAAIIGVHGTPYASIGRAAVPGRPLFWRALKARPTEFSRFGEGQKLMRE